MRDATLGFVPQRLQLSESPTVAEGLAPPYVACGATVDHARVESLLERLGVTALAAQRPHELSVGQAPRAALARALLRRPRVLLVDEPVRVQGFMVPLEPADKQMHLLLSSVPTTCPFCVAAGLEGLIEVRSKMPVMDMLEPVLIEGRLAVLRDDPCGLSYRIADAAPSPQALPAGARQGARRSRTQPAAAVAPRR